MLRETRSMDGRGSGRKRASPQQLTPIRPTKTRRLVSTFKKPGARAYPAMAGKMSHFKLRTGAGSPKRKAYRPKKLTARDTSYSSISAAPMALVFDPQTVDTSSTDCIATAISEKYPALAVVRASDESDWVIIQSHMTSENPTQMPSHNPRMMVFSTKRGVVEYIFQVHFVPVKSGTIAEDQESFWQLVQSLVPGSSYYLCPGLPESVASKIQYDYKSLRRWGFPFNRADHKECQMWFPLLHQSTAPHRRAPTCPNCTKLLYYVNRESKKRESLSPTTKAKKTMPDSRCPISSLTPNSRAVRERNIRRERTVYARKVCHYRKYVTVNDAILAEADQAGKGEILRKKWKQDVADRHAFQKDQEKNG